ncbi:MAG TPA: Smr/MutS family protein [Cytophagaceae bacterium]|jgi:DNA mismatch repair protein MutS2
MLYPANIEEKLGFDQIRDLLNKNCLSELGQSFVTKMRFSTDYLLIGKLIRQTAEFKKILEEQALFPSSNYIDALPLLQQARIEGTFLEPLAFFDIKLSLNTIRKCLEFFEETTAYPELQALTLGIHLDKNIYKKIDEIIDDRGDIRDNASPALREIRMKIISEQSQIRKALDRLLNSLKKEGYTEEGVSMTVRNGRMVIPVLAEHKRKIKGFIHDESSTGQTVFLEPAQVLDINNEIKDLQYQEKREIIRLLTELTNFIRPYFVDLRKAYVFLGLIDFIRAKAKLSISIQGTLPTMVEYPMIKWKGARHPLLYLSLQAQGKSIIPLSIALDAKARLLIISGPNAGGKSVCLKTVGLVQYIFQCGLLPPVNEGSEFGIFNDLFVDIGDEQSIENDLSTYSSHLNNMKNFINFSGKKSLIMIDEFGTGTEPQFGGAIAEAVLEELNAKRNFGVITTHYANLKIMADKTEGIVNGAMVFDMLSLEPKYVLEMGKPGSSFALEIAKKIGLPDHVIERSKGKLSTPQVEFESLNKNLELEKAKYHVSNERVSGKEKALELQIAKYTELQNKLDTNQKQLLNQAKEKAKQLLVDANKRIEQTIRDIKETKADKDITKMVREELIDFKESLTPEILEEVDSSSIQVIEGPVREGDYVRVRDSGALGKVAAIRDRSAEILIGELKSTVKLNRLEKISKGEYKKYIGESSYESPKGMDLNKKMAEFSPNLDLRGKRGEEALGEVDNLVDNALMFGIPEVRIVHGKGDGILRTLIRNHLKSYTQVLNMKDEHADRGGAGVTIVRLKS